MGTLNRDAKEKRKMNSCQKILWRLKVLFFESWGKNWEMIRFSLLPAGQRDASALVDFLERRGVIEIDRKSNFFKYGENIFYYDCERGVAGLSSIIADFVSIYSSRDRYFYKNFIKSSSFYFEGPYELGEVKLRHGDFVVDVGANIGVFTVLASKIVGASGKVLAFEPAADARTVLEKNIRENKLTNVEIFPFALSDTDGTVEFAIPNNIGDSSGYFKDGSLKQAAEQITLDNFVKNNKIKQVDFIKADIEGMERNLIKGAAETIKKFKPRTAICIYHREDDPSVIEELLKEFVPGYKIKKTEAKLYALI